MSENSDIFNGLDGYKPRKKFECTCCNMCAYFEGEERGSCAAYPNGIPDRFAIRNMYGNMVVHTNVEPDQEGRVTLKVKH